MYVFYTTHSMTAIYSHSNSTEGTDDEGWLSDTKQVQRQTINNWVWENWMTQQV